MTIFRWIVGVLGTIFALSALFSFIISIAFDASIWMERARRFRHWL